MTGHILDHDWYPGVIPENVELHGNAFLQSSYALTGYFSQQRPGMVMGDGSGLYQFAGMVVAGTQASIRVGRYTCLNDCKVIAFEQIEIGSHCLVAWRTVITDSVVPNHHDLALRQQVLRRISADPERKFEAVGRSAPVKIEDAVWIGFDSVICGGVTIGRGAVIGCKTVITEDVPPYAVVAGNPPRIVRFLTPDDTPEARADAFGQFGLSVPPDRDFPEAL